MVEYSESELDGVFSALSDSTRRAIVGRLREGPATVGELAKPYEMTFQGVSKHLKKLEAAGLVRRRKEGREVWCELILEPMRQASTWIEEQRRFWEPRLDRLGEILDERAPPQGAAGPNQAARLDDRNDPDERASDHIKEQNKSRDESNGNENH